MNRTAAPIGAGLDAAVCIGPARVGFVGDRCLIVAFDRDDPACARRVRALADVLRADPLPGVLDVVPAFTTLSLDYRPERVGAAEGIGPHDALAARIEPLLARPLPASDPPARTIDIPVRYGGADGPDLDESAQRLGLTPSQLVARHMASAHVVRMLGFAPGFAYIGGLDPTLALPRRATPRTRLPAGSVAIAADQSCIYPLESPGGWNLIGRTDVVLFDPDRAEPCLLQPGDHVRFVAITGPAGGAVPPEPDAARPVSQSPADTGAGAAVEVLEPGLQATLQDAGRFGHQSFGVTVGGVMDETAQRVANACVGNARDEAVVEILSGGLVLRFTHDACIALAGADLDARLDRARLALAAPVDVRAGQVLRFGRPFDGLRACLAVRGGFAIEPVLGSRSTHLRAGWGGWHGRALRAGDWLPVAARSIDEPAARPCPDALAMASSPLSAGWPDGFRTDPVEAGPSLWSGLPVTSAARPATGAPAAGGAGARPDAAADADPDAEVRPDADADPDAEVRPDADADPDAEVRPDANADPDAEARRHADIDDPSAADPAAVVLRFVPGPQWAALDDASRHAFTAGSWRITPAADRMGYRLGGPVLALSQPLEMQSEAVSFGTVQLPPDGQPIVLLADRQSAGGYPKIGAVTTLDAERLAQLAPGETVRFVPVDVAASQALVLARERLFRLWLPHRDA